MSGFAAVKEAVNTTSLPTPSPSLVSEGSLDKQRPTKQSDEGYVSSELATNEQVRHLEKIFTSVINGKTSLDMSFEKKRNFCLTFLSDIAFLCELQLITFYIQKIQNKIQTI